MLTRSNIIAFLAYSRRWESKTKKIFQISKKLLKKCREVYSNLKLGCNHVTASTCVPATCAKSDTSGSMAQINKNL